MLLFHDCNRPLTKEENATARIIDANTKKAAMFKKQDRIMAAIATFYGIVKQPRWAKAMSALRAEIKKYHRGRAR